MPELRELWSTIESLDFDWISVWDHFYAAQVGDEKDCFESVASHAALAALTTRVRVGCLVYSAGYRHPAVLANAAVTIDHLSSGRLELGVGAGWHENEYVAYGLPFEPAGVRLRRLAEFVEVVRLLWTEDHVDFNGEFYELRGAICNPKPEQATPRIWIGGSGERVALPQIGRIADGWNGAYLSPEAVARKFDIVRSNAPDPDAITASVNVGLTMGADTDTVLRQRYGDAAQLVEPGFLLGSVDAIVDKIGRYRDAGAEWIILAIRAPFDVSELERFSSDVIPQVTASAS